MFLPGLILHADPPLLRLVCAVAFTCGLTAFLFGLRRPQDRPKPALAPLKPVSPNPSPSLPTSPEPEIVSQQLIRLSLPSLSARSTEMTQQEKVAAALVRAGIANPAGWTSSSSQALPSDNSVSTSTAIADPPLRAGRESSSTSESSLAASRGLADKLLLFGGALVALISLCLFFRIR